MAYDMVIETPEALKAWKEEKIRLINAKRQDVMLIIKSVAPSVAENIRRWLRYSQGAIETIANATTQREIITAYNVIMADYQKLVAANTTKENFTTKTQSGVQLTGKKTGSPSSTKATTGGAMPRELTYPISGAPHATTGSVVGLVVIGVLAWIILG